MTELQKHIDGIEIFDISTLNPGARGFSGAVCDGRYLYLVPLNNGVFYGQVARYDTTLPFDTHDAWSFFDSASIHPDSRGFAGLLFDGRYIYLLPFCNGQHHGQVTRYDTTAPFSNPESWSFFDTAASVHPNSRGFISGCYDGRYIYMAPYQLDTAVQHGQVTRYDTQAPFLTPSSWAVFDTTRVDQGSLGFHGAVHDTRYVYMIPFLRDAKNYNGSISRYNTESEFTDPTAWENVDLTIFNNRARGFVSACHQGEYLYLVPYFDGSDRYGQVARYHTGSDLADPEAWTWFDSAEIDPGSRGFFGAISDGRFIYFIPHCRGIGAYHGQITRYDSRGGFTDPASWAICDTGRVHPDCRGFMGGVIHDGYLYMPPFEIDAGEHSGLMVRLQLGCETPWLP